MHKLVIFAMHLLNTFLPAFAAVILMASSLVAMEIQEPTTAIDLPKQEVSVYPAQISTHGLSDSASSASVTNLPKRNISVALDSVMVSCF